MKKLLGFGLLGLAVLGYLVYREMKAMDEEEGEGFAFEETPNELLLSLDSNASTGYAWKVLDSSSLLRVESVDILPAAKQEGKTSPDITEIRFRLLAEGEAVILLQYGRPWEGGEKETPIEVKVKVEKKGDDLVAAILSIDEKTE